MAKDTYLEIEEQEQESGDQTAVAAIYVAFLFFLGAFILLELNLAKFGAGLFK